MSINLNTIKAAVEKAFTDLTTLEVATLTSPSPAGLNLATAKDNDEIFTAINASLTDAKLVAYTKFELDGDSINYVSNNESLTNLVAEHKELVKSSLETRKALFDSVYQAVKGDV